MSTAGKRERKLVCKVSFPEYTRTKGQLVWRPPSIVGTGKQYTVSEGHPVNRRTGSYDEGGPFYTSRVSYFANLGHLENAFDGIHYYSGPVLCSLPTTSEQIAVGFSNIGLGYGNENTAALTSDGTTAISRTSPTNPATNLGTTLAEIHREGLPSLPGIQSWKRRTEVAKAAGSEYLNYQFGWAPLVDEIHPVVNTVRDSTSVMKQYSANEGRNTHRRYDFPLQHVENTIDSGADGPFYNGDMTRFIKGAPTSRREISLVRETKKWFEGPYTYALPSSADSWKRALGIGSQADRLFGIALTPDILWELTPWSWAVDWFSNAGDVVNNVTNFGLAGLVLRYGYIMEESIETVTARVGETTFNSDNGKGGFGPAIKSSPCSSGISCVTKRRVPANPFGFGIAWSGLSPTQLAITAALGITKLL